jgi:ribosomal protein L29
VKAKTLRALSRGNVIKQLNTFRTDLAKLRVAKLTQGPSKAGEIGVVRKNIARALTVAHAKQLTAIKKTQKGRKYKATDLRVKKTRAIRRNLNYAERKVKTVRQLKKLKNAPKRVYAIKA